MKLEIEIWVLERNYSVKVKKLFTESIMCYRNGAYRASLLFSYIGFLTIIKEVLIKAQVPPTFSESEWNNLIKKINADELWEKEVYESLIRAKKTIFPINEDLKIQLKYWKDRRNDCAHYKNNEIESHHTESFWSFIKSNVPKMTVEGGMASLINKFDEHFDDSKTPPGRDFTHLVKEIPSSVLVEELENFFNNLKRTIDGRRWWYGDSDTFQVFAKILEVSPLEIKESLVSFLKEKNRDIMFLNFHPEKINFLNYTSAEIRTLWKKRIINKLINANPLKILSALYRAKLVPNDEIKEANENVFNSYSQTENRFLPETHDLDTLKANGFFETIFKIAIQEKDLKKFMWVNSKCDIIISYIENCELKIDTVKSICNMAKSKNPSQWLMRELVETFSKMEDKKNEFHRISKENGFVIPLDLK